MRRKPGTSALRLVVLVIVTTGSAGPAAAQFNNKRMARPEVNLPGGPVRHVILESCTACHGIDDYAYNALDRAGWRALVEAKEEQGPVLSDDDRSVLLDWLVAEFGPDSTPFPRDYVITPVDSSLFTDNAAAGEYLATTCGACHSLDRVETAGFTETRWQALVADMKGRGAAVADENIEDLVAYLTRTRGASP